MWSQIIYKPTVAVKSDLLGSIWPFMDESNFYIGEN